METVSDQNTQPTSSEKPQPPVEKNQKTSKSTNWSLILTLVGGFILVDVIGFLVYQNYQLKNQKQEAVTETTPTPTITPIVTTSATPTPTTAVPTPTPTVVEDETAGWNTYISNEYDFEFKYPTNFRVLTLVEKPFYTLSEPIEFGILLTQDVYTELAQTPAIKVQLIETDKTVDQILDQLRDQIAESEEAMEDPEHMAFGQNPPEIRDIEVVQIGIVEATKVDRYGGPGAPNTERLEYYVKTPDYIFVFSANYGTYMSNVDQDGTVEKELLPKILATFIPPR